MQVAKAGLMPSLKDINYDKVQSPTYSASKADSLFNVSGDKNSFDVISAFQNFNLVNSEYSTEVTSFESARYSLDNITRSYNGKLTDVNYAERDYHSAASKVENISGIIQTISTSIENAESSINDYESKITNSSSNLSTLDSEILDVDNQITANESIIQNHYNRLAKKNMLSASYNNAVSRKGNLVSDIRSADSSLSSINNQLAMLDAADALPVGDTLRSAAKNHLSNQKKEIENRLSQLEAELSENDKVIGEYRELESQLAAEDEAFMAQVEGRKSALEGKKQQLHGKKNAENSTLNDFKGKKKEKHKELSVANGALDAQNVRLTLAEQNEVQSLANLTKQREELNSLQSTLDQNSASFKNKQSNLDRADNNLSKASELLQLTLQKHKTNRK